ncbi:hypothetical protein JR316_0004463 [Psilocybe cubensis]|uniref:Uncharacterized protein n=1 Tax=Psilocybe cubensis TaxID=181762 RepID=A0ACB8H375_PSICU|nr:hypothetical protein JR316_0004463 [Psilocybe cubensis]KAH9482363.1 hypothetical protein JR316_0004463 [Psilocybe cubensis]
MKIRSTVPDTFFLDVYFNATPVQPSQDSQDRRTVKNALAPTRIAYVGGQAEFIVDMGFEYATRLVIFHGQFESVFLAIYGDDITEKPEIISYEPKSMPVPISMPISSNLDPANSPNPMSVAEQLLLLMDEPPPSLSVATRLIFSLKPEKYDWDLPGFPELYSELDIPEDDDLERLVKSVGRPIREDISSETITRFAERVHDILGTNASDDAYYTAKLLGISASQQTKFSRILLEHLDLPQIYNEESLDDTTIHCLLDAASNIEIAAYFLDDNAFRTCLENIQTNPRTKKSTQKALKRLLSRLHGWKTFQDSLTNPRGDFASSIAFLKDITTTEHSIGCWLECMMTNNKLVNKLGDVPRNRSLPLPLFQRQHVLPSYDEFLTFVRALVGVSTVLPVLAWADSVGSSPCRERALAVLVLWQGIDGYREIVNHCLLLRQITKRLQWNTHEDPPLKAGMFAERLLIGLAKEPQAMLREDLVDTILDLKGPFSCIETEELMEMKKLAMVARDGLPSAVEELTYTSVRPFSLRRLRVLRVSLAIITNQISHEDGELKVANSFWTERSQAILPTLITILRDLSNDLNPHFALKPPPRMNQALTELLLSTAGDTLHLIRHFAEVCLLINRDLQALTFAIADLYACSDAALTIASQLSVAYSSAQNIRFICPEILRSLAISFFSSKLDCTGPRVILRTLLDPYMKDIVRDPIHHISQVYDLVDRLLPLTTTFEEFASLWVTSVFPQLLTELFQFCHLLDPETRSHFLQRLVVLDNGETAIGEWILGEELKELANTLHILLNPPVDLNYRIVLQYHVFNSLHFCQLLLSSATTSAWTISSLSSNEDLSQLLDTCLSLIFDSSISASELTRLTSHLASKASQFGPDVRFNILLLALRNAESDPSVVDALDFIPDILKSLPSTSISHERLRTELGRMICTYSDHASVMTADNAEMLLQILEWLASKEDNVKMSTLIGISREGFHYLCTTLASILPSERERDVVFVENRLSIDGDEVFSASKLELVDSLTLPLGTIEDLLSPTPFQPSTPKSGNKTPDILGVVISPPTALLRSPAATGLTKTYANNDFRQLRQTSSTRVNTSRLPSTHVDVGIDGHLDLILH